MRFFHPMDARWCCPSTVFSFLLQLCSCYFSITYFYCQPAIIVCMFCGPFVLAHGCYMTREFRREHQDTVLCNCWSVTRKPLHLIKVISVLWTLGEQRYLNFFVFSLSSHWWWSLNYALGISLPCVLCSFWPLPLKTFHCYWNSTGWKSL